MLRSRRNPYVAGTAINDESGLFGRGDVLQLVETVLRESHNNVIVLFGQRRIGKTSILFSLQKRLKRPPFVTVYFDLMGRASDTMGQVAFELASKVALELDIAPPVPNDFQENGDGFRETFLPRAYAALAENRLIVLVDEFDVLDARTEETLSPFSAHKRLLRYIYDLINNETKLGFVFVVGRKTEDLSMNYRALFKTGRYQRVSVLPRDATVDLIRQAEQNGALDFDDEAINRIYALASGHPYFTQLLCSLVFERAFVDPARPAPAPVTTADVDAILPQSFEAGEQIFEWIWDGLAPAERLIFSAVAAGTDEGSVISEDSLVGTLAANGVDMVSEQFDLAPRKLVEWEMLRRTGSGYRFFIELMRRWVAEKKPLSRVRDEIDRVNPMADRRFELGAMLRQGGQLEEAVGELRNALNLNSNHFKARRMLALTYKDLNRLDDAVREWSEVFRRDQSGRENQYGYASALLTRAEDLERRANSEQALADYERVLEFLPADSKARGRRNAILEARGQAALAAGDLDGAISIFERAEAGAMAAEARLRKRQLELRALAENIPLLEQAEKWDEAVSAYERLSQLDPQDTAWTLRLERAREEQTLAHNYAAAKAAVTQREWDTAQQWLHTIIILRPGYKDTRDILNLVVGEKDQLAREAALNAQAEKALQAGDLSGALASFEKGNNSERAADVRRTLREREEQELGMRVERLTAAASAAEAEERWSDAADIVRRLIEAQPANMALQDKLRQCETQVDLRTKYAAGTLALFEGRAKLGRQLLSEVAAVNPGYKDTAAILKQLGESQTPTARQGWPRVVLLGASGISAVIFLVLLVLIPSTQMGLVAGATQTPFVIVVTAPGRVSSELVRISGQKAEYYGVAWSPDGTQLASASADFTVRI